VLQLELPFGDDTLEDMTAKPKPKTKRLPKLSDSERHKRFVEMAREVEASHDPKDFEKAFKKIVSSRRPLGQHQNDE
jgi:hypothetical protein